MRKKMMIAAMCFAAMANAQSFRVGPAANVQLDSPTDMKTKVGFAVGARGEMDFKGAAKGLFLDAAVLFDAKNWKSDGYYDEKTALSYEWKYNTYGLSVPVNMGYRFDVSKPVKLFIAAGPYLNIGFGGKSKVTTTKEQGKTFDPSKEKPGQNGTTVKTETTSTASSNVYSDKLMNRLNWGVGFKVGAEICNHYQVNVGYELGLSKIFKNSLDSKHRTLSVGVAYMF